MHFIHQIYDLFCEIVNSVLDPCDLTDHSAWISKQRSIVRNVPFGNYTNRHLDHYRLYPMVTSPEESLCFPPIHTLSPIVTGIPVFVLPEFTAVPDCEPDDPAWCRRKQSGAILNIFFPRVYSCLRQGLSDYNWHKKDTLTNFDISSRNPQ